MLRLRTDLRVKSRLTLRCDTHPRYSPESGAGAIRGGCKGCSEILDVYEARQRLFTAAKEYQLKSGPFEAAKGRGTRAEGSR